MASTGNVARAPRATQPHHSARPGARPGLEDLFRISCGRLERRPPIVNPGPMLDLAFVALIVLFFAAGAAYVAGCRRLG
jgi:hypothetical protein